MEKEVEIGKLELKSLWTIAQTLQALVNRKIPCFFISQMLAI
jgi:hypothetical protein